MDSNTKDVVNNLNAGWYNTVTQAFGLDESTFRLAQGALCLVSSDSSALFQMANAVPPDSAVWYYDAGSIQSRADNYNLLLSSLLPESGQSLKQILGDHYGSWISFLDAYRKDNPTSTDDPQARFDIFANQSLDPRLKAQGDAYFVQSANLPLLLARNAWADPQNRQQFTNDGDQVSTLFKYSATFDAANQVINRGKSVTIDYDSTTAETKLSHVFAQGSASGFWDIFSGGASGSFEQLNTKAADSSVSITGKVNKIATLPSQAVGWFSSAEFSRAYNAKDNMKVWDPGSASNWGDFFAEPDGNLARYVSQLILVSGYEFTVTSHASYSQEDFQQIKAAANFGIWPFFSASANVTKTNEAKLNTDSTLSVTYALAEGLIEIWGVSVQPAGSQS